MRPVLLLLCLFLAGSAGRALARPNIILCMTDDQGWGDAGFQGHPHLKTPHLDAMAKEGIVFTRFYAAAAMCSPTRASCLTGRNPYRMGVTFAMKGRLEPNEITLMSVLRKEGYTTGHFGKWHLGTLSRRKGDQKRWGGFAARPERYYCPPWERDVDVCFVTESKVPTWDPLVTPAPAKRSKKRTRPEAAASVGKPYGNDYFTGPAQTVTENTSGDDSRVIMDRALPFIQDAVRDNKPFLAVIWFHTPHSPVVGGAEDRALYAGHPEPAQHYYACLTAMDKQVGRLRTELARLQVADNTMLWFCSDNGPARQGSPRHVGSNGGLSGYKLSVREGGIRVPGLLVWPDEVRKNHTIDAPCVTSDYLPTILDALGVPLPDDRQYDGISLLPLIRGERTTRGFPIGFLNKNGAEAVWMEDRYKLIATRNKIQLYSIPDDPNEKNDLAETLPKERDRMLMSLNGWKKGVTTELKAVPK